MSTSQKTSALDRIAAEEAARLSGDLPTQEEEARLSQQEIDEPFTDEDGSFWEYIHNSFIKKGISVEFTIKKDGSFRGKDKWPLSWESLREKYGTGIFKVSARNRKSGQYIRSCTEEVESAGVETAGDNDGSSQAIAGGGSELMTMLSLMQRQDERRAEEAREERRRDEERRREDREREEQRRKEERDSKNDLFKTLIAAVPALIPLIKPKEDNAQLEVLKLQLSHQQETTSKLMERLERVVATPPKSEDPFKVIEMLQAAEDRGYNRAEKVNDKITQLAQERAEEIIEASGSAGSGEDDSSLSMILKSIGPALGPAIGALMSRGQPQVAAPAPQTALPIEIPSEAVARPARPVVAAKPPSKDEHDQKLVLDTVLPFLGETLTRMGQQQAVDPKASARECLELLKPKGFGQARVLQLFTKDHLFRLLREYSIPEEANPWFNQFYGALEAPLAPLPPPRQKPTVKPLHAKAQTPGKRAAPATEASHVEAPSVTGESTPAEVLPPETSAPRKSLRSKPDILTDAGLGTSDSRVDARGSAASDQSASA